ncbi:uncharacterized protein [Primulina eburnea]|uniref:uncharacterized protein n=1 Tax=Primulina eburnea TaxID=1245227 RepID=UPI003C6C6CD1
MLSEIAKQNIVFALCKYLSLDPGDLASSDKAKLPDLLRWVDYIQNNEDFGELLKKIQLEKVQCIPSVSNLPICLIGKVDDSNAKKTIHETKVAIIKEADSKVKTSTGTEKVEAASQATPDKKILPGKELGKATQREKEVEKKDEELNVGLLKIQIVHIRKAWKHPSADSLLVEEIEVGEAKCRQVNRRVVLITNVKPGKLRDVMSEGLVLCASNQDHSIVEPLIPQTRLKLVNLLHFLVNKLSSTLSTTIMVCCRGRGNRNGCYCSSYNEISRNGRGIGI